MGFVRVDLEEGHLTDKILLNVQADMRGRILLTIFSSVCSPERFWWVSFTPIEEAVNTYCAESCACCRQEALPWSTQPLEEEC